MSIFLEQELDLVLELEKSLFEPEARRHKSHLEVLLERDFFEFAPSGAVRSRDKALNEWKQELSEDMEPFDFDATFLSADIVHVTFKTKHIAANGPSIILRSSLWERKPAGWQLIFRQATPVLDPRPSTN